MTTPKLPPGAPMDEQRLEEIAHHLRGGVRGFEGELFALATWLAARLEESELWCARFANDSEAYRNGREAGVREASAEIARVREEFHADWRKAPKVAGGESFHDRVDVCDMVARAVLAFGATEPPPHEQTLARCRRYEEALRRLATHNVEDGEGPEDVLMRGIARETLEGGS